jgi:transposase-like protein
MYSYEDRIRAVKLYIRLGKRLSMTVRQLGYPTTKALERWYRMWGALKKRIFSYVKRKCRWLAAAASARASVTIS